MEIKISRGGTEIAEKTREQLKLRALRVSAVNDFSMKGNTYPVCDSYLREALAGLRAVLFTAAFFSSASSCAARRSSALVTT